MASSVHRHTALGSPSISAAGSSPSARLNGLPKKLSSQETNARTQEHTHTHTYTSCRKTHAQSAFFLQAIATVTARIHASKLKHAKKTRLDGCYTPSKRTRQSQDFQSIGSTSPEEPAQARRRARSCKRRSIRQRREVGAESPQPACCHSAFMRESTSSAKTSSSH